MKLSDKRAKAKEYYQQWVDDHDNGYYDTLTKVNNDLGAGKSAFTNESWERIVNNEGQFSKMKETVLGLFAGDTDRQKTVENMIDCSRDVAMLDNFSLAAEGWGGPSAPNSHGSGVIPGGLVPFVIAGWNATSRSQEIYNIITQEDDRIFMSYTVDYLLDTVTGEKLYAPGALRDGSIEGFNLLPSVKWSKEQYTNETTGTYEPLYPWMSEDGYVNFKSTGNPGIGAAVVQGQILGNLVKASGFSSNMDNSLDKNGVISNIKYLDFNGDERVEKLNIHYDQGTGEVWKRTFAKRIGLPSLYVDGVTGYAVLGGNLNLNTGEFLFSIIMEDVSKSDAKIIGIKYKGRVTNIGNNQSVKTVGSENIEILRECEYKQYVNIGLNEYMMDAWRLGDGSINYAAYATDRLIEWTSADRELAAESHIINNIDDNPIDSYNYELSRKLGGFNHGEFSFDVSDYTPGVPTQGYKDGIKTYISKIIAASDTYVNVPEKIAREYIFLGYSTVVNELPNIEFKDMVVDHNKGGGEQNFGFGLDTRCGFMDNFGRSVRVIGCTDIRWANRGNKIYGTIRTFSMTYPFMVYMPFGIRMFTTIDANMPGRTAITIGGREYRDDFAICSFGMRILGTLDKKNFPVNNFGAQMANGKMFNNNTDPSTPSYVVDVTPSA